MRFKLRNEEKGDWRAVEELVRAAFWNHYVPGCTEHFVLRQLRNAPAFLPELSVLAEVEGEIVGQIAYTRAAIRGGNEIDHPVITFGPVSVLPRIQKQGIGEALIIYTLALAARMGHAAICIYGDPRYYSRFGFRCAERYDVRTADGMWASALMALELCPGALEHASGRFMEDTAVEVEAEAFAAYDATFPPREKKITANQAVFSVLSSLRYEAHEDKLLRWKKQAGGEIDRTVNLTTRL